ncbi:MAG: hypothetical protein PWR31_2090 [Bacillota bacterium]|nr:hypothetical protein [Bacillota bacterium]
MAETRPEEIVKLLNADPAGEHQAILQYLQHAWSMSDVLGERGPARQAAAGHLHSRIRA